MSASKDVLPSPSVASVMILAGGTGGHIYPGLAVANALQARGVVVRWMGASGAMEERIVPRYRIPLSTIVISGVRGKNWMTRLAAPLRICRAVWAAITLLKRHRPGVVISFGGFAAGPGGIAARCLGIPLVVHEQNRVAGLTNKVLARIAVRVLTGFPGSFAKEEVVGNPIRQELAEIEPPTARMPRPGALRVLVLGGSQGALALNRAVPAAFGAMATADVTIWHQTGQNGFEQTQQAYRSAAISARVVPFIENMVDAYTWADVVICRAGASTLAELCAVGVASILVPFGAAVDDHQSRNAEYLVAAGAALLINQSPDLAQHLQAAIMTYRDDPSRRLSMANAARALAKPKAAEHIAAIIVQAFQPPSGSGSHRSRSLRQKGASLAPSSGNDRHSCVALAAPILGGELP